VTVTKLTWDKYVFSGNVGLQLVILVESFSVCIHVMYDGIVTGDCPVLYCAALRRTQVVDECNASACSVVLVVTMTPVPSQTS